MANYKELCCKTVLDVKADLKESENQMRKEAQKKSEQNKTNRQK